MVAQLTPAPLERRKVPGGMKNRIQLLPGWDDPVDLELFAAVSGYSLGKLRFSQKIPALEPPANYVIL